MRIQSPRVVIDTNVELVTVFFKWRPRSPDPGDDLVIDCAMNADASVVTSNVRHYRLATAELGLSVMQPVTFANLLAQASQGEYSK